MIWPRTGLGRRSLEADAMQEDGENSAGVGPGDILAGKYRIERVLGIGGMGVVVAAQHLQLDEKVAIKFLLPAMLHNQEVVGRFSREARAAVKIKSEHVARVSDVGTLENGAPYMVMEFLEGGDLAAWIEQRGPLPIEQAVDFVLQACVGVASAHGIGIVHRDLKPANLFCLRGNDGQFVIKVLDFGISKVTDSSDSGGGGSMTHTSAVMGSPFYMSPEQMQSSKDVDAQTDIWALGVILYELVTGTPPFGGESFAEIAIKVATTSFAPVRSFRPDAPAGLEGVIFKCLEKDKRGRYSNVAELALALADFGSRQSRPCIERIVRIVQASGLSGSALALPPSPPVARTPTPPTKLSKSDETAMQPEPSAYGPLGTMSPSANTAPGVHGLPRGRSRTAAVAVAGTVVVLSVAAGVGWKMRPRTAPSSATGASSTAATTATSSSALPVAPIMLEAPKTSELAIPPEPGAAHSSESVASTASATPQPVGIGHHPTTPQRPPMDPRKTATAALKPPPATAPTEGALPPHTATKQAPVEGSSGSKPFNPLFDLKPK
jgi:eukaryotic-like serine/threonine-protein kinase